MMHEQESLDIVSRQTNRSVEENRNSKDRSIHREATDFWQRGESSLIIFDREEKAEKIIEFSINGAGIIEYSYYSIIQKNQHQFIPLVIHKS